MTESWTTTSVESVFDPETAPTQPEPVEGDDTTTSDDDAKV